MSREEDAYVIERMGKLLAEIAIIVNGPEPHDTLWSYHDLPEKVRALKQAPPATKDGVDWEAVAADQAMTIAMLRVAKQPAPAVSNGWRELLAKVPIPPNAITFDKGWELLDELQALAVAAAQGVK